jgi:hypothetical protein
MPHMEIINIFYLNDNVDYMNDYNLYGFFSIIFYKVYVYVPINKIIYDIEFDINDHILIYLYIYLNIMFIVHK